MSVSYDVTPADRSLLTGKSYTIVLKARIELEEHTSASMGWIPLPVVIEKKKFEKIVEIHVKKANGFREKGPTITSAKRRKFAGPVRNGADAA